MLVQSRQSTPNHSEKSLCPQNSSGIVKGLQQKVQQQAVKLKNQKNELGIFHKKWNSILAICESVCKIDGMWHRIDYNL